MKHLILLIFTLGSVSAFANTGAGGSGKAQCPPNQKCTLGLQDDTGGDSFHLQFSELESQEIEGVKVEEFEGDDVVFQVVDAHDRIQTFQADIAELEEFAPEFAEVLATSEVSDFAWTEFASL